jgi:hypothetical protein
VHGGEWAASFEVRRSRRGRRYVSNFSLPPADCGDVTVEPGIRVRVGRRGRFSWQFPGETTSVSALKGRFRGRRPRSAVADFLVTGLDGCQAWLGYVFRRVRRVAVPIGIWRGLHSGGRAVELVVDEKGRTVVLTGAKLALRCYDGSIRDADASFGTGSYGWVRPEASFAHASVDELGEGSRQVAELRGSFGGGRASGSLRVVTIDGPLAAGRVTCDSGPLRFFAAWTGAPRRRP